MTISFKTFISCEKYGIEVKSKNLIIFSSSVVTEHPTSVWKVVCSFLSWSSEVFAEFFPPQISFYLSFNKFGGIDYAGVRCNEG